MRRLTKGERMRRKRQALFESQRGLCADCGRGYGVTTLQMHHKIPRGMGGGNAITNLVLLCPNCHDGRHREGLWARVRRGFIERYWQAPRLSLADMRGLLATGAIK